MRLVAQPAPRAAWLVGIGASRASGLSDELTRPSGSAVGSMATLLSNQ